MSEITSNFEIEDYQDKFEIQRLLGTGWQGKVSLVKDRKDGSYYALKEINRKCKFLGASKRILKEVTALNSLNNSNIVKLFYYSSNLNKNPFYIMEYCENGTLRSALRESKISLLNVINGFIQVLDGLERIHKSALIHRDIKLDNILLDRDNNFKISDFGLVFILEGDRLNHLSPKGNWHYASPEIIKHPSRVDYKTDIYSFGILILKVISNILQYGTWGTIKVENETLLKTKFDRSQHEIMLDYIKEYFRVLSDWSIAEYSEDIGIQKFKIFPEFSDILIGMLQYDASNRLGDHSIIRNLLVNFKQQLLYYIGEEKIEDFKFYYEDETTFGDMPVNLSKLNLQESFQRYEELIEFFDSFGHGF